MRVIGTHVSITEEDDIAPWNRQRSSSKAVPLTTDLPESLEVVVGNEIYIPKNGMAPWLRNRLIRLATFPDPEFYKAQAMRLPTHEKPRMITCSEDYINHIGPPEGCLVAREWLYDPAIFN